MWIWIAIAILAVIVLGTAAGWWFQGTKLDKLIDGARGTIDEVRKDADQWVGNVEDEVTKLRKEFEEFTGAAKDGVPHVKDFPEDQPTNAPTPEAVDEVRKVAANALAIVAEEKQIRSNQTEHLGEAMDNINHRLIAVERDLANKPSVDVINAVLAQSDKRGEDVD